MSKNHSDATLIEISEVAARFNVSMRTIRFYEQRGLLKTRRSSIRNIRLFDEATIVRLQQVLELKKLGMTLLEIKESIGVQGIKLPKDRLQLQLAHLHQQRDQIEAQIDNLMKRLQTTVGADDGVSTTTKSATPTVAQRPVYDDQTQRVTPDEHDI